jgi:hypothetical protein
MPKSKAVLVAAFFLGVVAVRNVGRPAQVDERPVRATPAMYQKRATLQETLLATRQHFSEWLAQQPAVRQAVTFGPWLATPVMPRDQADRAIGPDGGVDLNAKLPGGQPLWTPQKELLDGKLGRLPHNSPNAAIYLARPVRAVRAARLTVGIGSGDRLDVWLNGQRTASGVTHLRSGRYGCAEQVDGTRIDQLIVNLDLRAGEPGATSRWRRIPSWIWFTPVGSSRKAGSQPKTSGSSRNSSAGWRSIAAATALQSGQRLMGSGGRRPAATTKAGSISA